MSVVVDRYGVHYAPGRIAYLEQGRGGTNVLGLKAASPFTVKTPRKWLCNHNIPVNGPSEPNPVFQSLVEESALVRFMLPTPGGGVGILAEPTMAVLSTLCRMSSPSKLPVWWADTLTPNVILAELGMTDVQPMVIMGVQPHHMTMVTKFIQAAATLPRRLLICVDDDVPLRRTLLAPKELPELAWEALGASVLREHMLK